MKDFLELAKARYSVRKYAEKEVEQELLDKVLEAGNVAPTAKNIQPQKIYVIRSEEGLAKIRKISRCAFNAPIVLLVCYDADAMWNHPTEEGFVSGQEDASIVGTHIMLEAADLGLGTCWVNVFSPTETAKEFNLPANIKPLFLMPLGYPAEDAEPSLMHGTKKAIEETVSYL